MKLGIDYTPSGLLARYCIQCTNPATGQPGSWLFIGDSYKTGQQISSFFPGLQEFFIWLKSNGWEQIGQLTARKL